MKKLLSLLLVLALALVPTLSFADDDAACQNLYNMLLDELKSVDLEMTADEESYRIYLGYALDKNSLGDADVIFDAYSDAVTINVSYSNPLDEALVPQVISFFNRVNSTLYVGKLMVIKSDNVWYAAYEIFLSVDPENITDWDRNNVLAYTALALDTMGEMVDYITEIANGESADNVFAMWQADIGAVESPKTQKGRNRNGFPPFFDTDYSSALRFSVQKSAITLSIVSASAFASMPAASQ